METAARVNAHPAMNVAPSSVHNGTVGLDQGDEGAQWHVDAFRIQLIDLAQRPGLEETLHITKHVNRRVRHVQELGLKIRIPLGRRFELHGIDLNVEQLAQDVTELQVRRAHGIDPAVRPGPRHEPMFFGQVSKHARGEQLGQG